jgi:hypothetical protein
MERVPRVCVSVYVSVYAHQHERIVCWHARTHEAKGKHKKQPQRTQLTVATSIPDN